MVEAAHSLLGLLPFSTELAAQIDGAGHLALLQWAKKMDVH
jgi:hypothetical protein